MFKTTNNVAGCNFFLHMYKEVCFTRGPAQVSTSVVVSKSYPAFCMVWSHEKLSRRSEQLLFSCAVDLCVMKTAWAVWMVLFSSQVALPDPLPEYKSRNCYDWLRFSLLSHTSVSTSKDNSHMSTVSPTAWNHTRNLHSRPQNFALVKLN